MVTTGSGILAASYVGFIPYIIAPSLTFIYWPEEESLERTSQMHSVALGGSIAGSLLAGYIADNFGRSHLSNLGPVTLVVGTIGLAGASAGFSTMSMFGCIIFWQFVLGIGIGVQWTFSAVISAEYGLLAPYSISKTLICF